MKNFYLLICAFLLLGKVTTNAEYTILSDFNNRNLDLNYVEVAGNLALSAMGDTLYGMTLNGRAAGDGIIFGNAPLNTITTSIIANVITNVNCNGESDGSASATANGGTTPYTYSWSPSGGTNSTATGLSAGTYTITVTDNAGATASAKVNITQPAPLTVTIPISIVTATFNPTDLTGATGAIQDWTVPPGITSITISVYGAEGGLASSSYTQTPGLGAYIQGLFTVVPGHILDVLVGQQAEPGFYASGGGGGSFVWDASNTTLPLVAAGGGGGVTLSISATTLYGDGSATIIPTPGGGAGSGAGGIGGLGGSGGTSTTGTITFPGTGGGGCGWLGNGAAGTVKYAAGGGSSPLNGGTGGTAGSESHYGYPGGYGGGGGSAGNSGAGGGGGGYNGGGGGSYNGVSGEWGNGGGGGSYNGGTNQINSGGARTGSGLVIIAYGEPGKISCYRGNNGSILAITSGGTLPYTYSWSGGGTNAMNTGLTMGTYTLTVKDNCGASATAVGQLVQPDSLTVSAISTTNASCYGGNTGSTIAIRAGGTSPYTYSWNGGRGTNASISGLNVGTYTVTVNDSCGDLATASVTITQSLVKISIASSTTVLCEGVGSITAHAAAGGNPPYTYLWAPGGGISLTASDLSAGAYTITATDDDGCNGTASETIILPPELTVTPNLNSSVSCYDAYDGSVSATVSGGTSPYTYSWFPGGGTNAAESGLAAGDYSIAITDSNGCNATASINLSQPVGMTIVHDSAASNSSCNGIAAVIVLIGGNTPYTYLWVPGGQTTDTIKGQCAGTDTCIVTDNNGCSQTTEVTIKSSTGVSEVKGEREEVKVYPDPNTGSFTITGLTEGQVIELYNYLGQKVLSAISYQPLANIDISDKPNGIYLIRIQNKDGSIAAQKKIVKTQ